jgi:hypothetical protein
MTCATQTDFHRFGGNLHRLGCVVCDALAAPRGVILHTDLVTYLRTATDRYDASCLDIDKKPGRTVTDDNETLLPAAGLAAAQARLNRAASGPYGPRGPPPLSASYDGMPGSPG